MTPTIVLKDGKPFLILGSPRGPRIITTVANIRMGVIDYGMNTQEAVNAPRFHNQSLPDVPRVVQWFSPDPVQMPRERGHKIEFGIDESAEWSPHWSDGERSAIEP